MGFLERLRRRNAAEATLAGPARPVREILGIRDVRGGVVVLEDGRLRAGLRLGALNLALMTAEEQAQVRAALRDLTRAIEWPVQIIAQTRPLDLGAEIAELRAKSARVGGRTGEYGRRLAEELRAVMAAQTGLEMRRYVVVSYDPSPSADAPDWEGQVAELERRCRIVQSVLEEEARLTVWPMSTEDWLDLLHATLNGERTLVERTAYAAAFGHLAPYVKGG